MQKLAVDRRKWQRLPICIPVFVRGVDERGARFLEFVNAINVSAGGMLIVSRRQFPVNTQLSLEIPCAPVLQTAAAASARSLRARILRIEAHGDTCALGIKFSRPLLFSSESPRATARPRTAPARPSAN